MAWPLGSVFVRLFLFGVRDTLLKSYAVIEATLNKWKACKAPKVRTMLILFSVKKCFYARVNSVGLS